MHLSYHGAALIEVFVTTKMKTTYLPPPQIYYLEQHLIFAHLLIAFISIQIVAYLSNT